MKETGNVHLDVRCLQNANMADRQGCSLRSSPFMRMKQEVMFDTDFLGPRDCYPLVFRSRFLDLACRFSGRARTLSTVVKKRKRLRRTKQAARRSSLSLTLMVRFISLPIGLDDYCNSLPKSYVIA